LFREAVTIRRNLNGNNDPRLPGYLAHLGGVLWHQGKLVEAGSCCREAIALQRNLDGDISPTLADSLDSLAHVLKLMGRFPEAETALGECIKIRKLLYPDYHHQVIRCFDFRGEFLLAQGKQTEAELNYREMIDILSNAVESMPENHNVANLLAWRLVTCPFAELRDPPRAVELAQGAVAAEPKNGQFLSTLGTAQYRANDWEAAIESLNKSIELRGGAADDWFFSAMAHWQLGHRVEARKWYDKAGEWMDKNHSTYEELLRFRAEAAELLSISEPAKSTDAAPQP
jgi:tetratricopeptide (TPR) repeat protein